MAGGMTAPLAAAGGGGGGFLSGLTGILSGTSPWGMALGALGGLFGGSQGLKYLSRGRKDIKNLPGMQGPMDLFGNFGASVGGNYLMDPSLMGMQGLMGQSTGTMLGGGPLWGNQDLQSALANSGLFNAYQGAQSALGQQMGSNMFGTGQGLFQGAQGIGNTFANLVGQGPQDYTGGVQNQMFNMGLQNMQQAGQWPQQYQQQLDILRQSASPEINRQQNQLFDKLHAKGLFGAQSSATGEAVRGFQEAIGQQDLGFQNQAFQNALAQQSRMGQLGLGQAQGGAGLFGQNLNAFNQFGQSALGGYGTAGNLEGQYFNQALSGLQQNQQAGMQRLAAAQGLFGFGNDMFSGNYGLGLSGAGGMLDFGRFGLDAAAMPYQLQASLLGGSGYHAQALGNIAKEQASAAGGFFGGMFG